MDEEEAYIYVFVGWNKHRERVEVHPGSFDLTDAVERVTWITYGPDLKVRFEDRGNRGPFAALAGRNGRIAGYGNRGPRPPGGPDLYRYRVEIRLPDGPKTGSAQVINRGTKPRPHRDRPTNPLPPSGPPDIKVQRSGTTVSLDPETFQMPAGKPFVVWELPEEAMLKKIEFPTAAGMPFDWLDTLPANCVGVVGKRALAPGSCFGYEIEVEGLDEPVKGVIQRA